MDFVADHMVLGSQPETRFGNRFMVYMPSKTRSTRAYPVAGLGVLKTEMKGEAIVACFIG
jgi:hypothetical protein